ncbi:MAG: polysaccharide deacetylase family protein [Deltaproteobacteria bacterium]|nr:MAG: polysaccharide deacetylase family protein [Deltaproteobacteria bacterium]
MVKAEKERAEYSAIIDRKPVKLPGGARLGVWFIINVEKWDINATMARSVLPAPQGVTVTPDIPNYSWFDYGLRVGFWRLKRVLDKHQVRATMSLNAPVCKTYPHMVEQGLRNGWEILAHGFEQRAINLEKDERRVIRKTIETIREFTGKRPRGWMGPGLHETFDTPDILAEEGFEYVADWVNDDQPYPLRVKTGSLIAVPYTVELNDIPIYVVQHHRSPEIYERSRDAFDILYEEGAESARFMGISMHPYVSGAAHRIKYIDKILQYIKEHEHVLFMTGEEILDWYNDTLVK